MVIAVDLTSLNDNFSGLERYSFEVTKNLLELDKKNKYVLIFKNEVFPYFADKKMDNVSYEVVYGKKLYVNQFSRTKAIKKINPDIVYFPAFPMPVLFKGKKYRTISMIHDLVAWDCPKTMKFKSKLLFKSGIKKAIKQSSDITTNSNFSKQRIIEQFNYKKDVTVVPCASYNFDAAKIYDTAVLNEKYNIPNDYFLTLGTLEPRKNFDGLLSFYSEMIKQKPDLPSLVIVGRKGWKMDELLERYSNISDKVVITGFVDDEYLASIYYHSKAFLYSSIYEGFGIPVLEAVNYCTVPVVSNIPTNLEILGDDYDYVFKNEDVNTFIKAINDVMALDEDKKKVFLSKLQQQTARYSWRSSAEELLKLIDNK